MPDLKITFSRLLSLIVVLTLCASLVHSRSRSSEDTTPSGTSISNRAEATYEGDQGTTYSTVSETVTFTVQSVASLMVTPKETAPSASVVPQERVTRIFRICNTGNVANTYTITSTDVTAPAKLASLYFDNDASGTLTVGDSLIELGSTASPSVAAGSCLSLLALIDTNDIAFNSLLRISLTARSNASGATNGTAEDDGTIINEVGKGPLLSSPTSISLPPLKEINGSSQAVVTRGTPFSYSIALRNSGDVAARNLVLSDDLPAGVEYVAGSLRLEYNGSKDLTDAEDGDEGFVRSQHVEVRLSQLAPDQVVRLSFKAQLGNNAPAAAGLINMAQVIADNTPLTKTNTVVVVADPFGTVFAGRGGANAPIPGAGLSIFTDQASTIRLPLQSDLGFAPNVQNVNPFSSDALGHFSFGLSQSQVGTGSAPTKYYVVVTAAGFVSRLLEINVRTGEAGLMSLTERALDGQPLAVAGGFTLIRQEVAIENLADLAFNIPMFEEHGLEIAKSVDQQRAEIGDVVTYRIEVHNPMVASVGSVTVRDRLPESCHYVPGTAHLAVGSAPEQQIDPEIAGRELIFHLGDLAPGARARLLYRLRIGANARQGESKNIAFASGALPTGEKIETDAALATVQVGGGVFSTRQVIIGRVFEDVNRNGSFDSKDKPAAGVRLYLTSGQSVITDSQGLYNFPALSDGSQVISLDPVTMPAGLALADGGSIAGRSWTRLLRTPVGGGAMLRQNFVLVRAIDSDSEKLASDDASSKNANMPAAAQTYSAKSKASPAPSLSSAFAGKQPATKASPATPTAAGTYEFTSEETIEPVATGFVRVLTPAPGSVVMAPALELAARVALKSTVRLEVNGESISDKNIGTKRLDQKNQVATFTFVSIGLRPGPNRVRVTPIGPDGTPGQSSELTVIGRGPIQRLEVVPDKTAIHAGNRDSTIIRIKAFDKWNNPANDNQIGIETSLGELMRVENQSDADLLLPGKLVASADLPPDVGRQTQDRKRGQLVIPMEDGEASVKLVSPAQPGEARLHVVAGKLEMESMVRILPENRPTIMVGLAEMSFGNSIPEVNLRGEEGNRRNRLSFFYSGRLGEQSSLTLSYDSQRPINRTGGRDRLFQLDPLDRAYPVFGDSSTRFEAAQSNSKLYARLDHKRSYAMFGDLDADMEKVPLAGYTRKLTGVKLHLENSGGDFVSVTGARPDTSFARNIFPAGGLSIIQLGHREILQGSETVAIEVRDRRNPEVIISRELLTRSIDYNLDALTGEIFLLRVIPTFDSGLNLKQIVVTYEHQDTGMNSSVYTARGQKNFAGLGMKLGFSTVVQRQEAAPGFLVGGLDLEQKLPHRGLLRVAWATSQGEINGGINGVGEDADNSHNGQAFSLDFHQPLGFREGVVRARYQSASAGFLNPFGATVTPGSRRGEVSFDFKPRRGAVLRFGVTKEDNHTDNVDNQRLTFSVAGEQLIKERVRIHFGFDHRNFTDDLAGNTTSSDLVTLGAQIQVTDKLDVSIKREQNLGEADPTYPNQTTLAANYKVSEWAKIFFTQRMASAAIMPIGDFSQTGFAGTNARRETALGVESQFGKYTALVGRYQLENGVDGADSFAVFGMQNRLPITKALSLQLGFERGFHLAGNGQSFNSATLGFGWTPNEDFKASAHYEFRDRGGNGQLIALGAAGRITEGITALSRMRWSESNFGGRESSAVDGLAAIAFRPLSSDRAGLLFSFNHRANSQSGIAGLAPIRNRLDTLATDGYYQATKRLEVYGRFALRFAANGEPSIPLVSTFTYLTQARAQYRLTSRLDWAAETRFIFQPSSQTRRSVYGTEIGLWAIPDLRLGLGYNFTAAGEPGLDRAMPRKQGFYFTISSKLANLFDLLGTSKNGLDTTSDTQTTLPEKK